jgi:hypothetical protein
MRSNKEIIIADYIEGYNRFDINRMLNNFDNEIIFENISNGEVNLSIKGKDAFIIQAKQAAAYFLERKQVIKSIRHCGDEVEVEIDYQAIVAIDMPNGLKKGEEINLKGRSIFKFIGNQIISLTDIS